jgi:hypothetical protein
MVHEKLTGSFTIEDLIQFEQKKFNDPEYDSEYNVFVDLRGAIIYDFMRQHVNFGNYISQQENLFNSRKKCAFVAETPKEAVFAELLKNLSRKAANNISYQIFSTETGALIWLNA